MDEYHVVMSGTLTPGVDHNAAVDGLAQLFGQPAASMARLLQGQPTTIRRNVDAQTGERYVRKLQALGVPCRLEPARLELEADVASAVNSPPPLPPAAKLSTPASASLAPGAADLSTEMWSAIAGQKAPYYVPRWQRYSSGQSTFPSWHWPAFFVPFFWGLYRKAWAGAVVLGIVIPYSLWMVVAVAVALSPNKDDRNAIISLFVYAACLVIPALLANGFYYRKAVKLISEAKAQSTDPSVQLAYLRTKGGTSNVGLTIGLVFGAISLIGILAAIALPAYQDYLIRARVNEALIASSDLTAEIGQTYRRDGALRQPSFSSFRERDAARYIQDMEMTERGVLVLSFGVEPIAGRRIIWIPREEGDRILWTCQTVDVPPKYLPANCRTQWKSP